MIENTPVPNQQPRVILKCSQTEFPFGGMDKVEIAGRHGFIVCSWDSDHRHNLEYRDYSGNTISQLKLNSNFAPLFEVVNDDQIAVLKFGTRQTLIIWNIHTGNQTQLQLSRSISSNARLFIFKQTNLITLIDRHRNVFHASTFQLWQNQTIRLVSQQSFDQPTSSVLIPIQIDNHSKIALLEKQPILYRGPVSLYIYSVLKLDEQSSASKVQLEEIIWKHDIGTLKGDQVLVRLSDAWIVEPTILYLQFQIFKQQSKKQKHLRTHNFYWNTVDDTFKKTKLKVQGQHRFQFIHKLRKCPTGIRGKSQPNQPFPIYFINYETETLVGQVKTQIKEGPTALPVPSSHKLMKYDINLKEHCMQIKTWDIPYEIWQGYSLIAANLMVEYVQDCEDDLIFNVCQLLKQNPQLLHSFEN